MILALVAWAMLLLGGPIPIAWAIGAVVCGHVARHQRPGDKLAKWGLIIGYGWAVSLVVVIAGIGGLTVFGSDIRKVRGASKDALATSSASAHPSEADCNTMVDHMVDVFERAGDPGQVGAGFRAGHQKAVSVCLTDATQADMACILRATTPAEIQSCN
ncbi:MAG: hypothetical protein JST54_01060 [Deltaproteobacteria bacterium]|nr:hypothetical protein [Deltaproteobacteria bacterium]